MGHTVTICKEAAGRMFLPGGSDPDHGL